MRNLNPREKVLFVVTVIAVVIGVAWAMGLDKVFDSLSLANDSIVTQREEFEQNKEKLQDIYVIEKKYKTIGQSPLDQETNKRPITVFEEYVNDMARQRGFPPSPTRADVEDIEGAEEYQLLSVVIKTEGNFKDTIALLKDFENAGLLFRDVDLRGTRDRDLVVSRVTVARIARREQRRASSDDLFSRNR